MVRMMKGAAFALILAVPAAAEAQVDCPSAREEHQEALDKIQSTFRPYVRCLNESAGRDNCALEFKQIERAQKKFEDAIQNVQIQCNPQRSSRSGAEG